MLLKLRNLPIWRGGMSQAIRTPWHGVVRLWPWCCTIPVEIPEQVWETHCRSLLPLLSHLCPALSDSWGCPKIDPKKKGKEGRTRKSSKKKLLGICLSVANKSGSTEVLWTKMSVNRRTQQGTRLLCKPTQLFHNPRKKNSGFWCILSLAPLARLMTFRPKMSNCFFGYMMNYRHTYQETHHA